MKKILTFILTTLLALGACVGFTGCNKQPEKAQLNFGKELVLAESQLDTLRLLSDGSIDVSVIDSVMAGYYSVTGQYSNSIKMLDLVLATESYGIAGRKEDKALISVINDALINISSTGYAEVASTYGLTSSLCITAQTINPYANATDDSWNAIKTSGKIVIGYTVFAPICYDIVEGVPTKGFDIDLAKEVMEYINQAQSTNIQIEFLEIDWDSKETLLENGTIDLIWNGMTINEKRSNAMCISVPYLTNYQSAVILKEDASKYEGITLTNLSDKLANAIIGVEAGSAGQSVVEKAK